MRQIEKKEEGRDRSINVRGCTNSMSPLYTKNEKRKYADVVIEVFEIMMVKKICSRMRSILI